ncbi:AraC family transcriptional regulator [Paenibacillus sp. HB172176]|uniref:AraC family transcriptional regulator n=1 Tax=Paenibacillus sp. HB172176 TaxID=2493690 RepID=UPI00143B1CD9|nr:AraC family transcriptional regulator [Paenibacillus sp. HB172176]
MTYIPDYLKTYPNMDTAFPFHISLNKLRDGYRKHRHDYLEFSFVVEGSGSEEINDVVHPMQSGTFTFVLPYQVHQIFTENGSTLVLYNCMFDINLLTESGELESLNSLIDQSEVTPYMQLNEEDSARMKRLIEDMYKEYQGNEPWRRTMLQLRLREVLVLFDRARRMDSCRREERMKATAGARTSIWPIIHYIHQHYEDELPLSDLAARFSLSVSRISEVIKETTGQNFLQLLNDLRVRQACSLLVSTDMSVSEIALEVGYGSYTTFSRIFREKKKLSPKDYRKQKQTSRYNG